MNQHEGFCKVKKSKINLEVGGWVGESMSISERNWKIIRKYRYSSTDILNIVNFILVYLMESFEFYVIQWVGVDKCSFRVTKV